MVRRLQACSNLDLAVVRMLRSRDFVWQEEEEERTDTIAEKLIAVCFPLFMKQLKFLSLVSGFSDSMHADSLFISLVQFNLLCIVTGFITSWRL